MCKLIFTQLLVIIKIRLFKDLEYLILETLGPIKGIGIHDLVSLTSIRCPLEQESSLLSFKVSIGYEIHIKDSY